MGLEHKSYFFNVFRESASETGLSFVCDIQQSIYIQGGELQNLGKGFGRNFARLCQGLIKDVLLRTIINKCLEGEGNQV